MEKRSSKDKFREFASNPGGVEDEWAELMETVLDEGKVEWRGLTHEQRIKLQFQFNALRKSLRAKAPATFARYEKIRCFKTPEDGLTFSTKHPVISIKDIWQAPEKFKGKVSFTEDKLMDAEIRVAMGGTLDATEEPAPAPAEPAPRTKTLEELLESGELWKGK